MTVPRISNPQNLAKTSLEVLDLDFVKHTCASIYVNAKSRTTMICFWISLWIEETSVTVKGLHLFYNMFRKISLIL